MDKLNNSEKSQKKYFASHRNQYICDKLREVQAEQKLLLSNIMPDNIDLSIHHKAEKFSVCTTGDYVFLQSTDSDKSCPSSGYNPLKLNWGMTHIATYMQLAMIQTSQFQSQYQSHVW